MCENCLSVVLYCCCHCCCGANDCGKWCVIVPIVVVGIICVTIVICAFANGKYSSQVKIREKELEFQKTRMTQQESVKKSNECKSGNDNVTTANQKTQGYFVQVTPIE